MKTFDHLTVIGLREWIGLPGLGIPKLRAKIDSGAKTSALHASDIETFERDGETWVRFKAHTGTPRKPRDTDCEARLIDIKRVKSSNGHQQERHVIRTPLVLGDKCWDVDFTLTCRKSMRYRVLLGCSAMLDGQLVINPGLRFVQDQPETHLFHSEG
ncbi:ribosomal protein S6 modification protein [Pseudomonas saudimassiliensis]|uniref:Ribosomal protein S6 modification protein n=1 Tax=Pseudomonas saudimassiliensis TaxID=1461581 RepID=A0A078MAK3_9PSED|nr:ATP-dependent zinc protease [Pseudomonas saudimassiliensis]CEA03249.1 ribosomal protein S6 modification protein [Pseudomonas saudimassiliensis]CEF26127.1 ribosomal protein S6 modification protein [Pseudomonas saudimassiliensis]